MKRIYPIALLFASFIANAQSITSPAGEMGIFVSALQNGIIETPIPNQPHFYRAVEEIQKLTGSNGSIHMRAVRIVKFKQQPKCGRVAFFLFQPSTSKYFPEIGGQLNICEDAMPPKKTCLKEKGKLFRFGEKCKDGSEPVYTEEVKKAVSDAVKSGSFTKVELARRIREKNKKGGVNEN